MRSFRFYLTAVFTFFIAWVIYEADSHSTNIFFSSVGAIPYGDKIGHFVLYGLLAMFFDWSFNFKSRLLFGYNIPFSALVILGFAVIEEFTQILLESRNFDLVDILFDFLGMWFFIRIGRLSFWQRFSFLITPPEKTGRGKY